MGFPNEEGRFILDTDASLFAVGGVLNQLQEYREVIPTPVLYNTAGNVGQFSATFEYRPGAQHANANGLSRQCGQCLQPDYPVSSLEGDAGDSGSPSALLNQPFASSAMGDSMDADLLPELSREMWVAATYLDKVTADLPSAGSEPDLIAASRLDKTWQTVREWVQLGSAPSWSDCAGLSTELRSWQLQFGNLSIHSEGRLWGRRAPPVTTSQLVDDEV